MEKIDSDLHKLALGELERNGFGSIQENGIMGLHNLYVANKKEEEYSVYVVPRHFGQKESLQTTIEENVVNKLIKYREHKKVVIICLFVCDKKNEYDGVYSFLFDVADIEKFKDPSRKKKYPLRIKELEGKYKILKSARSGEEPFYRHEKDMAAFVNPATSPDPATGADADSTDTQSGRANSLERARLKADEISNIEVAAVDAATEYYESKGYAIASVENDHCGWDLTAEKSGETLQVEVKGHKGGVYQFELTPNEYEKMRERKKTYRVFAVVNALDDTHRKGIEFTPYEEAEEWFLKGGDIKLRLAQKIAAKAEQVD